MAWRAMDNPRVRGPCYPPPVACSPSCPSPPNRTPPRPLRHKMAAMVSASSPVPKSLKQGGRYAVLMDKKRKKQSITEKIFKDAIICGAIMENTLV